MMQALIHLSLVSGVLCVLLPEGRLKSGVRMILGLTGVRIVVSALVEILSGFR